MGSFQKSIFWAFLSLLVILFKPGNGFVDDFEEEDSPGSFWETDDCEGSHFEDSGGRSKRAANLEFLDGVKVIPDGYSTLVHPPTLDGGPTQVNFSAIIFNIRDISELKEEITLEMNIRLSWVDSRLNNTFKSELESDVPYLILNPKLLEKLWAPDFTINRIKSISKPSIQSQDQSTGSLRIYAGDGGAVIRYSMRLTVTVSCKMGFFYYPADTQSCNIDFQSYIYLNQTQMLEWRGSNPIRIENAIWPANFDVGLNVKQDQQSQPTNSGVYSGLRFTLNLRRQLGYHLLQTYLPSCLFVVASWLAYLVPPEAIAARMALSMTLLLTLSVMFGATIRSTPNVAYLRAMDIWTVVCIVCVFLALVEYVIILKIRSRKIDAKEKKRRARLALFSGQQNISSDILKRANRLFGRSNEAFESDNQTPVELTNFERKTPLNRQMTTASEAEDRGKVRKEAILRNLDRWTFLFVPCLFIIFNIVYWPWLLVSSEYFQFKEYEVKDKILIFEGIKF